MSRPSCSSSRRAALLGSLVACALLAGASPAGAARTTVGSVSSTPAFDCGSWLNDSSTVRTCTIAGLALPRTGVLTRVRVNHGVPYSATSTQLKIKRLTYDGDDEAGPRFTVLDQVGDTRTVGSGTTTTEWTDLTKSVTSGQYLGLTVIDDAGVPAASRLEFAARPGSGITFYPGDSTPLDAGKAGATDTGMNIEALVRTPPVIDEITGPSGPTRDNAPLFAFTADESAQADATGPFFDCRIDGADWEMCDTGEYQSAALAEGDHTFAVRALSQFGTPTITQTGPAAERRFRVDRTPPQTSIDSGPSGGAATGDPQPTFTFSADEAAEFECSLDGAAWLDCTSPAMPAQPLGDGGHVLEVAATDEAGNRDGSPARADFTVSRPQPEQPAASGPLGFDFAGLTASGTDPVDSAGGPLSSDIESARAVYDPAGGRVAVVVRFYGSVAGAQRDRIDVLMAPTADCSGSRDAGIWFSTDTQSAPVRSYGGSELATGSKRISDDGREVLLAWSSPRIANLPLRCLEVQTGHQEQSWDAYVVYDRLVTAGFQRNEVVPPPIVADVGAVMATLRGSLPRIARTLGRHTPRQLARKAAVALPVDAPGAGAIGLELSVRRGGKKRVLAVGAKPVTRAAEAQKVRAEITAAGRKILRKGRRGMRVAARAGFRPEGSDRLLAATRSVRLSGRR